MKAAPNKAETADAYFSAVEDAVMQTPRGRWFLREYARRCRAFESDRILDAIHRLQDKMTEDRASTQIDILRRELQEMSSAIVQTRREIAAMKPEDAGSNRIMAATEELDAIVTATERATSDILGVAEKLQNEVAALREAGADAARCEALENGLTEIFLACSFQDITGQRTTKVVNVLRYLEQRVNSMIEIWGVNEADVVQASKTLAATDTRPDAHLLNGPAKEGEGVNQDDVDKMFGGDMPGTGTVSQDDIDGLFK